MVRAARGDSDESRTLIDPNNNQNNSNMKKLYAIFAAAAMMTAASASATTWGVIGTFSGWTDEVEMEQVSDCIYQVHMESLSGEFKLRGDHDWMLNYGADVRVTDDVMINLVKDGPNINIPGTVTDVDLVFDSEAETLYIKGTFDNEGIADDWYVVGGYCGWDLNQAWRMWDSDGDGVYSITMNDFEGEFKLAKNRSWDGCLGSTEPVEVDGTFALSEEGGNMSLPYVERVQLVFDSNDLTLTILPLKADEWSVIGSFNGWSGDVDMEKVSDAVYKVELYGLDGEFKFRYDHNWGVNLGGAEEFDLLTHGVTYPLMYDGYNLNIYGPADVRLWLYPEEMEVFVTTVDTVVESVDVADGAEYYGLDGVRVSDPRGGMFIRVQGGKATKVAVR